MKTLIAVPCMDTVPYQFALSMIYLEKGNDVAAMMKPNSLVYDSRNLISLAAIESNFDRVMWIDSDMILLPNALKQLHADMDELGCDMVTGLFVKRHFPVEPVIYQSLEEPKRNASGILEKQIITYTDYPRDDVFPVKGCGFGCVLTTVKLLKAVWDKFGPAFNPLPWAGEDISFCHRVNQLGYEIYCDSRVTCGHVGTQVYSEDMLKRGDANG